VIHEDCPIGRRNRIFGPHLAEVHGGVESAEGSLLVRQRQLLVADSEDAVECIKRPGRMDDVADVALFLCSDRASFMTGQTILVDGGYTKKPG
jgi:NAD(P)-dependent dehydrogenase (short-subunit alcohol dehydrogenase family)